MKEQNRREFLKHAPSLVMGAISGALGGELEDRVTDGQISGIREMVEGHEVRLNDHEVALRSHKIVLLNHDKKLSIKP